MDATGVLCVLLLSVPSQGQAQIRDGCLFNTSLELFGLTLTCHGLRELKRSGEHLFTKRCCLPLLPIFFLFDFVRDVEMVCS